MRVGDTYKIKRMVENGNTVEDILERFKNDYSKRDLMKFIPKNTVTAEELEERNASNDAAEADEKTEAELKAEAEVDKIAEDEMRTRIRAEVKEELAAEANAAEQKIAETEADEKTEADKKKAAQIKKDEKAAAKKLVKKDPLS